MGITITPTSKEVREARAARRSIERLPKTGQARFFVRRGQAEVPVSEAVSRLLYEALSEVAEGGELELISQDEDVSTQIAADMLNVSRPFLIKLLNQEAIPFHYVGSHRRIARKDVLAYKAARDQRAVEALHELARHARELNLD